MKAMKEWLSLFLTPTVLLWHHYTQWQGLLNVYGAALVVVALIMLAVIAGMIIMANAGERVDFGLHKDFSPGVLPVSWAIFIVASIYLFWTGHLFVGAMYVLVALLGTAARLLSKAILAN
jgi:hypothetical protein